MIAITGASGHLGRLVITALLQTVPAGQIVAAVRNPAKAQDLAALGVQVRQADYSQPATLASAFQGVSKLLLISSSEVGQRTPQHRAVIEAAQAAGVQLLAYTSLLHAERSPLGLAAEHVATEALIKASGLPAVLTSTAPQAGQVYELAGDSAYTLAEFAAELARQSNKPVIYQDLPPAAYEGALKQAGLPDGLAALLADSDAGAAQGGLFDEGHTLSRLIGRPTTPLAASITAALQA